MMAIGRPSVPLNDEETRHDRITAYDANFIALAMEMGVHCVTEDTELLGKFPLIAVSMEDFVNPGRSAGVVREARTPYRARKRKQGSEA